MAEFVLEDVAVVAELDTLPAVEIVDNLLSAIEPASIVLVTVPVSVVLTTFAIVNPWADVVFSMCKFASRKSLPIPICLTFAPAEWAIATDESILRVIVKVLFDGELGYITSTISSRAVSGSITTVNVSPEAGAILANRFDADVTVIVVALLFSAADKVVSAEMDEYKRVVID